MARARSKRRDRSQASGKSATGTTARRHDARSLAELPPWCIFATMNRRDFVMSSMALAAWRAAEPAGGLRAGPKFGYAAITWGGNDRAAIDDIAGLGFRGIQLRASAVTEWGQRPIELRQLLAERKLSLVALSSGVVSLDPATMVDNLAMHVRNAQFVQSVGGLYLQVVDERPTGRAPTTDDYVRMGQRLTEIGWRTADLGVTLGYHNHMGNLGQAPDEVARVLDAADSRYVKLELDTAHYQAAGGDPAAAVRRYADRLLFLHLKDLQQPIPERGADSYQFVELGRGMVNIRAVLAELELIGFSGWAIVELDRAPDPARTPRECAMISKQYLESNGYRI